MTFTIITPNRNGERYLEATLESVLSQRVPGVDVEYIVIDGNSTDGSHAILDRYRDRIDQVVIESDDGPAAAINKGLALARGEIIGWLNADDLYRAQSLRRVAATLHAHPRRALCFGRCDIINASGAEIRRGITHFKHAFFPLACRFTIQTLNYVSQPAMFFRRRALEAAGPLRTDLAAAWDYELLLRLWRQGGAARVPGPALAAFRWHAQSISGRQFKLQFKEELDIAAADAGRLAPQTLMHHLVRWGIVGIYAALTRKDRHAHRR